MLPETENIIRNDFASFVRKAFSYDHDGQKLGKERYIDYLCHELDLLAKGNTKRLVINLPPRHLKSFLAAICLPAWILAHKPSARIMVITYSDQLAQHTTYKIRHILQSSWFKQIFKTRIAEDRARVDDFSTTQGGQVYATSVGGGLAGRGADFIIFDDPLDLKEAGNIKQIELVNERFDSLIMSRLNDPRTGRIVIIAHRLNDNDLSAHVRKQGGWRVVLMPLIAVRKRTYDLGYEKWVRKRGEQLRPGLFTAKQLKHLRENTINPDFETYYQQGHAARANMTIKAKHFAIGNPPASQELPMILSVDPGQRGGVANSFSVIQAWCPTEDGHYLLDQWREQCTYERLRERYWYFVRNCRPSVALIEATANGPALISDARRRPIVRVIDIVPDNRSKAARLIAHAPLIRRGRLYLPEAAIWRADYIKEFVEFPAGQFDDQIDATTQYLDWIAVNPIPALPPKRAICAGVNSQGVPLSSSGNSIITSVHGMVVGRRRY
jgi:predicted phage terminase large subunit-like protein